MENTQTNDTAFISIDEWLNDNQKSNLNIVVWLLSFSAMLFHFAAVYFFTFKLGSLAMVGIFLWLGNFFAFLFDVPVWILQYYLKSKTLLFLWALAQIVAVVIFANFIFGTSDYLANTVVEWLSDIEILSQVLWFFLDNILNLFLLVIASLCYWFSKEANDITLLSYVLNNASPAQYKSIIAQNNLFSWVWGLLWLVISWVILEYNPQLIIFIILAIFAWIIYVSLKFFDSKDKVVNLKNIKKYSVYFDEWWLDKAKKWVEDSFVDTAQSFARTVLSVDLKKTLQWRKYIFMKPIVMNKDMITMSEMIIKTKQSFIDIYETLKYAKSTSLIVYWAFSMVLTFGFWDTFASTFLLAFLDQVKEGWSYILLWIIAVPAFTLQDFFWKLSDKYGPYAIANIWLAISGWSLLMMSLFAGDNITFSMVLILAIANSVWYAICMSLSVAVFLESYNKSYAEKNSLKEIDSNASAAPMKILQNLANVVWLVCGWFILKIADYQWFFAIFGIMILCLLGWSLSQRSKLKGKG